MKAELVPTNGDPPIPISKDVTVVGRREFCDVQIASPSLSKRHAVLVRTDGLLMVRDLASTNGTKVNGQKVLWAALLPNDRLTLGRYKFKVYLGSDTAPSPSETYQTPRGQPVARPTLPSKPSAAANFAPPNGSALPQTPPNTPGSTDPDSEVVPLDEFLIDDEEEFAIDLD